MNPPPPCMRQPKNGLPVNRCRTRAAAALNALWPDVYPANGGVGMYGMNASPRIFCVPNPGPAHASIDRPLKRNRIALIGRT